MKELEFNLVPFEELAEQIVAGEPRLRVLYQVFIFSGCRDSRGQLNSDVRRLADRERTT